MEHRRCASTGNSSGNVVVIVEFLKSLARYAMLLIKDRSS